MTVRSVTSAEKVLPLGRASVSSPLANDAIVAVAVGVTSRVCAFFLAWCLWWWRAWPWPLSWAAATAGAASRASAAMAPAILVWIMCPPVSCGYEGHDTGRARRSHECPAGARRCRQDDVYGEGRNASGTVRRHRHRPGSRGPADGLDAALRPHRAGQRA